jgi:hypothetical protein
MIESIFMMLLAIAFILWILGIEMESIVYSGTSLILWLVIMAQSFYIQVPGIADYSDVALRAFVLVFIFTAIINIIIIFFDLNLRESMHLP